MKRTWLITAIALILIGCMTAVCALAALDWDFSRFSTVAFETNTYPITEDFHNISLRTETAHITVLPADGADAYIVCREQENLRHTVTVTDGTLTVALSDDRKWYEYIGISTESSTVTLYLPEAEYGTLLIRGSTGDVGIPKDFRFESISVEVSTGDVRCLASAKGEIALRASTGEIRAEGLSAKSLAFAVSTGRVQVSSAACEGAMLVTVSTGKAELSDIRCGNLSSAGSTGDLLMERVRAAGSMLLSRDTGDIRFVACDAAEIKVTTDTGDVTGTLTSDKIFITESDTGTVRVPSSVAGGKCEITTDTGDIRIEVENKHGRDKPSLPCLYL